ncbi:MAG: CAP domain-containing protein [Patescibacteria group bacterium]
MFPTFKKWFIPSSENDYLPYSVRVVPFVLLSAFVGFVFLTSASVQKLLTDQDSFLAAVVASVLVDLANGDRAGEGLHGLSVNPTLVEAAQAKADDMARAGYFSHNSPDGKTPWYWFGEAGYQFSYAGENLAVFFGDSADVERAWMNSPSHRANILSSNFTEIGIATAEGYYQGQPTVFVVQMFGAPATKKPLATVQTSPVLGESAETIETGSVGGETIEVVTENDPVSTPVAVLPSEPTVIHEDDMFIAVKNTDVVEAPSDYAVERQTNIAERVAASPHTTLTYVYGLIGTILALAVVLFVFLEFHIQKPTHVFLSLALILFMGLLLFFTDHHVALAELQALSSLLPHS